MTDAKYMTSHGWDPWAAGERDAERKKADLIAEANRKDARKHAISQGIIVWSAGIFLGIPFVVACAYALRAFVHFLIY